MGQKQNSGKKKEYAVPTETMALLPLVPSRETPHPLLKSVKTRQMFPKALSAVRSRKRTEREQQGLFYAISAEFCKARPHARARVL